jgi:hypothetical protein
MYPISHPDVFDLDVIMTDERFKFNLGFDCFHRRFSGTKCHTNEVKKWKIQKQQYLYLTIYGRPLVVAVFPGSTSLHAIRANSSSWEIMWTANMVFSAFVWMLMHLPQSTSCTNQAGFSHNRWVAREKAILYLEINLLHISLHMMLMKLQLELLFL